MYTAPGTCRMYTLCTMSISIQTITFPGSQASGLPSCSLSTAVSNVSQTQYYTPISYNPGCNLKPPSFSTFFNNTQIITSFLKIVFHLYTSLHTAHTTTSSVNRNTWPISLHNERSSQLHNTNCQCKLKMKNCNELSADSLMLSNVVVKKSH